MAEKTTSRETTKDKENPFADMAEQAARNCEQALRSGLKLQQQASQWWGSMLDHGASAEDWHERFTQYNSLAHSLAPATQQRMEEVLELVEKSTRTGTELYKKAAEAAQTPAPADSQAKWMDFWTASLGAARANTEAVMQINSRAMNTWLEFIQKNAEIAQPRTPKAG